VSHDCLFIRDAALSQSPSQIAENDYVLAKASTFEQYFSSGAGVGSRNIGRLDALAPVSTSCPALVWRRAASPRRDYLAKQHAPDNDGEQILRRIADAIRYSEAPLPTASCGRTR
jgi:hypothetical protein